jgi:hypothetical protein
MKVKILSAIILSAVIPFSAVHADVKSDMANAELSLIQVVSNATAEGMSIADIVAEMIAADPAQA